MYMYTERFIQTSDIFIEDTRLDNLAIFIFFFLCTPVRRRNLSISLCPPGLRHPPIWSRAFPAVVYGLFRQPKLLLFIYRTCPNHSGPFAFYIYNMIFVLPLHWLMCSIWFFFSTLVSLQLCVILYILHKIKRQLKIYLDKCLDTAYIGTRDNNHHQHIIIL